MMTLMDSMTDEELDCTNIKVLSEPSRIERIARGEDPAAGLSSCLFVYAMMVPRTPPVTPTNATCSSGCFSWRHPGAGRRKEDMLQLLEEYKRLAKLFQSAMKGMKIPKNMKGKDAAKAMNNMDLNQVGRMLPPGMLQQMGGVGALQNLMKQFEGKM